MFLAKEVRRFLLPETQVTDAFFYILIYLTATGMTPGGSSTVYIYTQTIHRTTQRNTIPRTEHT